MRSLQQQKTIGDLCDFSSGHGFSARDWAEQGWPIIRIQNLNGSREFNYYEGETEPDWFVEPGDLLFAWAGTRGVSFGPAIWTGPKGVLNQHIYKVHPRDGVDARWLHDALQVATARIERKAHGFKSTLLHVHKKDITGQRVYAPPLTEQENIADTLEVWDRVMSLTERLIAAKLKRRKGLMQQLLTGKRRFPGFGMPRTYEERVPVDWEFPKTEEVFESYSIKNRPEEPVLSVTQDQGVVRRDSLERLIQADDANVVTYKLIEPGSFVISLRSFQGGLEFCDIRGLVSPAYHVIRPKRKVCEDYYRYYFKSPEFIQRLAVAIIGIRDGKQVSYEDFSFMRIPVPPLQEQRLIAETLSKQDRELSLLRAQLAALKTQKRGLMQRLLTGKVRVQIADAAA